MIATLAAIALGLPVVAARDERSLFHLPGPEDVRLQTIQRSDNERDWPFAIDSGYLACVWSAGQKVVMFMEKLSAREARDRKPGLVFVSTNPFDLTMMNIANRHLIIQVDTIEDLIRRMGPFYDLGKRLCEQPRGSDIGPGEL